MILQFQAKGLLLSDEEINGIVVQLPPTLCYCMSPLYDHKFTFTPSFPTEPWTPGAPCFPYMGKLIDFSNFSGSTMSIE
jgi:hypothetical protein